MQFRCATNCSTGDECTGNFAATIFSFRGTPFSIYYRTAITAEAGVKIDLLTYGAGQNVNIPGVRIIRIPKFPGCDGVKIGPSFTKLFLDIFLLIWTVGLLLRRRYTFVHAHEEAVFWVRFLKPLFRFKLVYDMHSSLPQQLTNFNFTKSRLLIGIFAWLEKSALRHSDAVITICPDLHERALKCGAAPGREFLIENSLFDPILTEAPNGGQATDTVAEIPRSAGHRIVYAGTFEDYQGVDLLIRGFSQVQQKRSDLELVLVGGTPGQIAEMRRLAKKCQLNSSCVFVGRVSRSEAARWLASANVVISPRVAGSNTPLKIYELLASNIPIIATNIWSHTQVLSKHVCFLVEPTPESLAAGIEAVVSDPARAQAVAAAARKLYESTYSRAAYKERMGRLLHQLESSCAA